MADLADTPKPQPPTRPGAPFPRLSYSESATKEKAEGTPAEESAPESNKVRPPKKVPKEKKGKPKPGQLEETPKFDTYEARRTMRIVVGAAVAGVVALVLCVVYWTFNGRDAGANLPDEGQPVAHGSSVDPAKIEIEARQLLQQAQLVAQNGNVKLAMSLLERLSKTYPNSAAGKEAQEALARPKQGLPLFVAGPAIAAKAAEHEPEPPKEPPLVIDAVEPSPSAHASTPAKSDVQLVLPSTPAEPRKASSALAVAPDVTPHPLPSGFRARAEAGVHASGWPLEIVGDRDGATMVLVPGGTFVVGRDDGPPSEGPAHQVTLATFYIDQHEATVRQFARFQQETGHRVETKNAPSRDSATPDPSENLPAVRVNAQEARDYAKWAGKALPTEAQWEAAARTPDGRIHPWGSGPPPWDKPRNSKQIDGVMSFSGDLSPYGIYDLAGNAWEWTADWFDPKYHEQFKNSVAHDPIGPARSHSKPPQVTIKGGSTGWLSSWRQGMKADARLAFLGFRCALTVEQPTGAVQVQSEGAPTPGRQSSSPATKNGLVPF